VLLIVLAGMGDSGQSGPSNADRWQKVFNDQIDG
jgi:hypothetical protein